jgi:hypothetical protein
VEGLQAIESNSERQERQYERLEKALLKVGGGYKDDSAFGDSTSTVMELVYNAKGTENIHCMFTP